MSIQKLFSHGTRARSAVVVIICACLSSLALSVVVMRLMLLGSCQGIQCDLFADLKSH